MRKFIFPLQDAAVYSEFPYRNAGQDEILEIGKTNEGRFIARSLIRFDLPTVPASAKYDLVLFVAMADRLMAHQGVEVCHLSQSWTEGTGYFYQEVISTGDGVTWTLNSSGSSWPSGSEGGSHLTAKSSSSLANPVTDLTFDVTDLVRTWISGTVLNNGFLVQFPTASEVDYGNKGNVKCFSNQTHTIYRPVLIAKWDDSAYSTGSIAYTTSSMVTTPLVDACYRVGETVRVEVVSREKYPLKAFGQEHATFAINHYIPSSSYYSIVDDQSDTVIIPFSDESKISSVGGQNYFHFVVENMYPRRYYRVLLRIEHDGVSRIADQNAVFTVK